MKKIFAAGVAALLMVTLAACKNGAPSPTSSGPAATGAATTGGHAPAATATVTTITTSDPCQLVTAQEASALTGASYGAGTERAIGPGKTCVYGGNTKNVFMVDLWQGSASQLQQVRDQVSAQLAQAANTAQVNPIPVPGLGDAATAYTVNAGGFNGSSIFALKGTNAIYLVDEVTGGSAPTTAALTAAARTALGRLP